MASDLYDTGAPRRVIVVNEPAPDTALARAQRDSLYYGDLMMKNLVEYLARHAERNAQRREPPEATRASGPVIDVEFEAVTEAPPRPQLAAPKTTRRKKT